MNRLRETLIGAVCLMAAASLGSCRRAAESPSPVGQDVKGVAKDVEKTAKDIGRATGDLADKAGDHGDDAWITTKVKSELTAQGFDPLHVHVDTSGKVVTLSGTVEAAADARKAVSLAKAVKGVAGVQDHLFVDLSRAAK
jgi:osmotically-inducible protein OsmY